MDYRIRMAAPADAAIIAHHRVAMFHDMGILDGTDPVALKTSARDYLRNALVAGAYTGWLVENAGQVVAGGGVITRPLLPRPGTPQGGEEAYILNVYTEPEHRRRGLARQLLTAILTWCRERRSALVSLHASDEGRPLYESLGFGSTNEMRLEPKSK